MTDCIFCKIAAGEIPATFAYRDDDVVAIHDVNPQAPSHVLVMPVKHAANIDEFTASASPHEVAKLMRVAAQIGQQNGGQFRTVMNTGAQAGQTVDHLHLHILAGREMHWPPG
jgi:histidine triad (HIT) family protein